MPDPLQDAIAELAKLKNEHRGILSKISSDPGMNPETRRILVDHLYEEEDEQMSAILALQTGGGAATPAAPAAAGSPSGALTVGSLRPRPSAKPILGSLRPTPDLASGPGTVGSLRHG